ncbi:MAG: hypothetical protein ACJAZ0_002744 [Halioglobus sp.]|jgi:hypothetical protein
MLKRVAEREHAGWHLRCEPGHFGAKMMGHVLSGWPKGLFTVGLRVV